MEQFIENVADRYINTSNKGLINFKIRKMYIVKYYGGSYDDSYETDVFVTDKKSTATKYVTKFNKMLKKWKEHYQQYETDDSLFTWIDNKYIDKYFMRWNSLQNITKCYYTEIECR
jgi:hypothetical protein